MRDVKETVVEKYLRRRVKRAGGMCEKLYGANEPDRECRFPGARLCYVETKRRDKSARIGQRRRHAKLWSLGFPVLVIDTREQVDRFIETFTKGHTLGGVCKVNGGPAKSRAAV